MIKVLPDHIANQIAAGEVVERPASVVKELLENALDAGARSVKIEIEGGGRRRIRCTDDGSGMDRDDALLALERHATSKLADAAALSAIATLGFRGEALPSIASVSHLTLETCRTGGEGTRVRVAAGKVREVEAAGLPTGTSIEVANLFVHQPARRKFLKSEATELGHIVTLVTHYALAYPEVRFQLESGGRSLLAASPAATHADRLRQVLGAELVADCVEFADTVAWAPEPGDARAAGDRDGSGHGLGLFGFASRPEVHKINRNSIFVFVNRRLVRDRLLQHGLSSAYYNLLPNGVYPAVLLFLELPYAEVDVNVHPAKTEVRFRRQNFVHDAVRDTVRTAISAARPVPSFLKERRPSAAPAWAPARGSDWSPGGPPVPLPFSPGADAALGISSDDLPGGFHLTVQPPAPREQRFEFPRPEGAHLPGTPATATAAAWVPETGLGCGLRTQPRAASAPLADELEHLRPLGQIHDSFIVAAGPTGLWLIDQHVAHERVLFEQYGDERLQGTVESQRLLVPMVVGLDPGRWIAFAELAPELNAAGFEAEPFGHNTVAVKSAPAGIRAEQVERLLDELLQSPPGELRASGAGDASAAVRRRVVATIACHAAIKINMRLEMPKMEWLLGRLAQTRDPMTCPHGRPVLLRYSLDEIQRAFKRIS